MARMTGGQAVVETLKTLGIDTVFGIVSVHNVPIYDAVRRDGSIRAVPVRHEQGAIYMADGFARSSGRVAAAITSTGPGAANAVGGLFEAQFASSPVLHITGQVNVPMLDQGKGVLHEAKDQLGMLRTVSRHAARVTTTEDVPSVITTAFAAIRSGRPGPASVEIPIDLQYAEADVDIPAVEGFPRPAPAAADIEKAAALLADSQRPLIFAGGGVISADASEELRELSRRLGAPVLTSVNGRGALPEDDPLCLGTLYNDPGVRDLLGQSDLMLAVGTRFQGQTTGNFQMQLPSRLVHVDIDREVIGRNYPAELGIVADARLALQDLLRALPTSVDRKAYAQEAASVSRAARERARSTISPNHLSLMDGLRSTLARNAIVVRDATVPVYMWGNRLLEVYEPRTSLFTSSYAIGPGLPLAIGAKLGRPDRQCVALCGDGGFMLNLSELATAVENRVGVKVVLFNDRGYGVLRGVQDRQFEGRRIGVDLATPDFLKLSDAFGLPAERVSTVDAFVPALQRALDVDGPALIDVDLTAIGPPTAGRPA